VFACVSQIVEIVEKVIPPFIGIEAPEKRLDFRSQIFASTPHAVFEISSGLTERERGVIGFGLSDKTTKCCVVQAGPKVFDNLGREDTPFHGKAFGEAQYIDFMNTIGVRLNDWGVWFISKKGVDLGNESVEVLFCAPDA
jgi:hypothetical protein